MSTITTSFLPSDYTIGWICALPAELTAAKYMLDEIHETTTAYSLSRDTNIYVRGRLHGHNVVIACQPNPGTTSAAVIAIQMLRTYEEIRFGLMVGIGGGAPTEKNDIRLGDIVVSMPTKEHGGVVQIDAGTRLGEGLEGFKRTGNLNKPPQQLLNAVRALQSAHESDDPKLYKYIS